MVPQPVVSTTFKRLKREWNEEKARKELRQLITDRGGRNVSQVSKFGYKDVWVGSQSYRYNPDTPLSKPLLKAMFDQTYVSYNVEMTNGQRKRHRDLAQSIQVELDSCCYEAPTASRSIYLREIHRQIDHNGMLQRRLAHSTKLLRDQ